MSHEPTASDAAVPCGCLRGQRGRFAAMATHVDREIDKIRDIHPSSSHARGCDCTAHTSRATHDWPADGVDYVIASLRIDATTSQRRIRVGGQRDEVRIEPLAGLWRAGHRILTHAVRVEPRGARIRHAVRLARRLDPDVGVDPRPGRRDGTLTEPGAAHIAPRAPLVTDPTLSVAAGVD